MAKQLEHHIRDWLVDNPDFIENGLQVIEKEHFLPDDIGSNGFIDILCKDVFNNFVIIEIKRSNPAARQAFTEVFKYEELIQNNYNARNSEIRIIIVSTNWDQMIRAFSHLCFKSNFSLTGLQIFLDEESNIPVAKDEILPISSKAITRKFMSSQIIYLFCNLEKRISAHSVLTKNLSSINFLDYVTVDLNSPNKTGFYPYALNIAFQKLSKIELLNFIALLKGAKHLDTKEKEFETEDEYINYLEQVFIISLEMQDYIDSIESSSGEKFESVTGVQNWQIESIKKFGTFNSDPRYTEAILLKELKGHDGNNSNKFVGFSESNQKERINEIYSECQNSLSHTPHRQSFINYILSKLNNSKEKYRIIIDIYNPDSIIVALYFSLTKGNPDYLPKFLIIIDYPDSEKTEFYCGDIHSSGKKPKMTIFNSDDIDEISNEIFSLHFFPENETVAQKMGLIYTIKKTVYINNVEVLDKFIVLKKNTTEYIDRKYDSIENHIISNKYYVSKMIKNLSNFYGEF